MTLTKLSGALAQLVCSTLMPSAVLVAGPRISVPLFVAVFAIACNNCSCVYKTDLAKSPRCDD